MDVSYPSPPPLPSSSGSPSPSSSGLPPSFDQDLPPPPPHVISAHLGDKGRLVVLDSGGRERSFKVRIRVDGKDVNLAGISKQARDTHMLTLLNRLGLDTDQLGGIKITTYKAKGEKANSGIWLHDKGEIRPLNSEETESFKQFADMLPTNVPSPAREAGPLEGRVSSASAADPHTARTARTASNASAALDVSHDTVPAADVSDVEKAARLDKVAAALTRPAQAALSGEQTPPTTDVPSSSLASGEDKVGKDNEAGKVLKQRYQGLKGVLVGVEIITRLETAKSALAHLNAQRNYYDDLLEDESERDPQDKDLISRIETEIDAIDREMAGLEEHMKTKKGDWFDTNYFRNQLEERFEANKALGGEDLEGAALWEHMTRGYVASPPNLRRQELTTDRDYGFFRMGIMTDGRNGYTNLREMHELLQRDRSKIPGKKAELEARREKLTKKERGQLIKELTGRNDDLNALKRERDWLIGREGLIVRKNDLDALSRERDGLIADNNALKKNRDDLEALKKLKVNRLEAKRVKKLNDHPDPSKIEELRGEIDTLKREIDLLSGEIHPLDIEIEQLASEIKLLNDEVPSLNFAIQRVEEFDRHYLEGPAPDKLKRRIAGLDYAIAQFENTEKLEQAYIERKAHLSRQFLAVAASAFETNGRGLSNGATFDLVDMRLVKPGKSKVNGLGFAMDEGNMLKDMSEIYSQFCDKNLIVDGQVGSAPYIDLEGNIHLPKKSNEEAPRILKLKSAVVSVSVQGADDDKSGIQRSVNQEGFKVLDEIIERHKSEYGLPNDLDELYKDVKKRILSGQTGFEEAEDLGLVLAKTKGLAFSIGCFSAKDRGGIVAARIAARLMEYDTLHPAKSTVPVKLSWLDRTSLRNTLSKQILSRSGNAAHVVQDNTGVTVFKALPHKVPGFGDPLTKFLWMVPYGIASVWAMKVGEKAQKKAQRVEEAREQALKELTPEYSKLKMDRITDTLDALKTGIANREGPESGAAKVSEIITRLHIEAIDDADLEAMLSLLNDLKSEVSNFLFVLGDKKTAKIIQSLDEQIAHVKKMQVYEKKKTLKKEKSPSLHKIRILKPPPSIPTTEAIRRTQAPHATAERSSSEILSPHNAPPKYGFVDSVVIHPPAVEVLEETQARIEASKNREVKIEEWISSLKKASQHLILARVLIEHPVKPPDLDVDERALELSEAFGVLKSALAQSQPTPEEKEEIRKLLIQIRDEAGSRSLSALREDVNTFLQTLQPPP